MGKTITMAEVQRIKRKYEAWLMGKAGVTGCAIGYKYVDGKKTDTLCIICYVNKKLPRAKMKKEDVISNDNIRPGDVIVGLSSYGQASYEKEYNGGMGSNGLTSARHDVFGHYLAEKFPESLRKKLLKKD